MKKREYLKAALIIFIISILLLVLTYFIYHHLGSDLLFHKEFNTTPAKPFVSELFGDLSVILLATSIFLFIVGLIKKE